MILFSRVKGENGFLHLKGCRNTIYQVKSQIKTKFIVLIKCVDNQGSSLLYELQSATKPHGPFSLSILTESCLTATFLSNWSYASVQYLHSIHQECNLSLFSANYISPASKTLSGRQGR